MLGCQTDVTEKAESRLHPRYKQMKDARPFEGIVSDKRRSDLSDQTRFSILTWNVGPMGETVADSVEGSFHVIMVQEAETVCQEIITTRSNDSTSTRVPTSSSCITTNTFEPEGVKMHQENPRGQVKDKETAEGGEQHLHCRLRAPEQHDSDVAKQLLGQLGKVAEKKFADVMAGDFNSSACRERENAKMSSIKEVWEETLLIRPQDVGQMKESGDCAAVTC